MNCDYVAGLMERMDGWLDKRVEGFIKDGWMKKKMDG